MPQTQILLLPSFFSLYINARCTGNTQRKPPAGDASKHTNYQAAGNRNACQERAASPSASQDCSADQPGDGQDKYPQNTQEELPSGQVHTAGHTRQGLAASATTLARTGIQGSMSCRLIGFTL